MCVTTHFLGPRHDTNSRPVSLETIWSEVSLKNNFAKKLSVMRLWTKYYAINAFSFNFWNKIFKKFKSNKTTEVFQQQKNQSPIIFLWEKFIVIYFNIWNAFVSKFSQTYSRSWFIGQKLNKIINESMTQSYKYSLNFIWNSPNN